MQSDHPIPGDPWPPDMVIAVNDADPLLTELMFINWAWNLQMRRIPPLTPAPDFGASYRPDTATLDEWQLRWPNAWGQAIGAAGDRPEPPAGLAADLDRYHRWMIEWMRDRPQPFTQDWGDEGSTGTRTAPGCRRSARRNGTTGRSTSTRSGVRSRR